MEQVYKFNQHVSNTVTPQSERFARGDSIKMVERALDQAEKRMANLRRLADEFGLDNPGPPDPRVA